MSAVDMGIDTVGALVMVAVVWLVLAVRRRVLRAADAGSPEPSATGPGSSRLTG